MSRGKREVGSVSVATKTTLLSRRRNTLVSAPKWRGRDARSRARGCVLDAMKWVCVAVYKRDAPLLEELDVLVLRHGGSRLAPGRPCLSGGPPGGRKTRGPARARARERRGGRCRGRREDGVPGARRRSTRERRGPSSARGVRRVACLCSRRREERRRDAPRERTEERPASGRPPLERSTRRSKDRRFRAPSAAARIYRLICHFKNLVEC